MIAAKAKTAVHTMHRSTDFLYSARSAQDHSLNCCSASQPATSACKDWLVMSCSSVRAFWKICWAPTASPICTERREKGGVWTQEQGKTHVQPKPSSLAAEHAAHQSRFVRLDHWSCRRAKKGDSRHAH